MEDSAVNNIGVMMIENCIGCAQNRNIWKKNVILEAKIFSKVKL